MRTTAPAVVVVALLTGWLTATPVSAAAVRCHGERATIVGTDRNDVLDGTPHRDVIVGLGGSDTIRGAGGNDLICGGVGADRLSGGSGSDRLYGGPDRILVTDEETDRIGDVLQGGPGNDHLAPGLDTRAADDVTPDVLSWEAATGPVTIRLGAGTTDGEGHDEFNATGTSVVGSPYGDAVIGSNAADRIFAGPGSDRVRARGGDDRVYADPQYRAGGSADVVRGGPGDDDLGATFGHDKLFGGPGDDFLDDFDNNVDVVDGGTGDDHVVGEIVAADGEQRYSGGEGVDEVGLFTNRINPAAATATGHWDMATGDVTYQLEGTVGMAAVGFEIGDFSTWGTAWTVDGSPLADTVSASGSTGTTFHGLDGDDSFSGSAYDDVFDGGPGTDRSLGMGVGTDTCISVEVYDYPDCENQSA